MFSDSNGGFLMKKVLFLIFILFMGTNVFAFDCDSASQCTILGKKLIDQKEYKSALECFDNAISMDEDDEFAYAFRARAKFYLKDYEGAVSDAEKSLEIRKNSIAYNARANVKFINGDYQGAIDDLTSAVELNPKYMQCYEMRAFANVKLGNYVEALEDAGKSIKLNHEYSKNYEVKARAEMGLKDYRSASRDFLIASRMYKEDGDRKNSRNMQNLAKTCKRKIK